uniref:Si:ch211-188p14.4 n=1 Tax=Fundulus heteroclitus TaxID=8078 RepID=A0A3Q2NWW5_FUNHE
ILSAPKILQLTFVNKIISLFKDPLTLLLSVPNRLASAIPPSLLALPEGSVDIKIINAMLWTPDQVRINVSFGLNASVSGSFRLLSPFVLQGFTCTSVQKMTPDKVTGLIRAVRPRLGLPKVVLKESQLTCMYNLVRNSLTENFLDYPSDMLLFFETQNIQKDRCRSYFSALGAADFSVASGILRKGPQLFTEATTCLGLTGLSLSRDAVEVLGNMVCTLDRSYIENSDPFILEKLKACKDLSDGQVAAVETLLLSGETTAKRNFLKTFMPNLRKLKTQKIKLKNLFRQIIPIVAKRAAGCTEGNISQVIISDPAFPFGYDETQFDLCLDIPVLRDNLNTICQKVDDDEFQKVILKKLSLAYPSGVPDQAVQMLGSVSRVATLEDISKWSITKVDTLSALFSADDGSWETEKSKEIIEQYLRTSGNSLGPTELTIIGSNLCSLNASRLKTISPLSILLVLPANVASCSTEQKTVLYETSSNAFLVYRPSFIDYYNLMKPYLGTDGTLSIL